MRFSKSSAAALAASIPLTLAQTSTTCNPTEKTCPKDTGLNAGSFSSDFTSGNGANSSWSAAAYSTITYSDNGAEFSIGKAGEAPTISSDFYIFFGRVDVKMRASPGTGIVSSIVFESDDLDEIDWEFLGGDTTQVETNFFGKGNTSAYDRATYETVSTPQSTSHTYSVDWTSERIEWIIDGTTVRTLAYDDPLTVGGQNYPQTPMRVKLGSWCGGCTGEPTGTVQWAGGATTFGSEAYVMYVESVDITNYNPADSYEYSDTSGSWQSIKIINGGSTSSPSGGSSSNSSSSESGSSTTSGASSGKHAPTSSLSVSNVMQTQAAVSTTLTGSAHSTGTAGGSGGGSTMTSVVMATTEVPGSDPTGASGSGGSGSGSSAASTGSGSAASSSDGANVSTGGASLNTILSSTTLFVLLVSFLLM